MFTLLNFFRPLIMALIITILLPAAVVFAAHGVSMDGKLKYGPDFEGFEYTSKDAVKGGDLVLHDRGSFDSMNPFVLKGNAPAGLTSLVFESLAVSSLDEPFAKYGLIAKDIEVAEDGLSVTFTLNEKARFSDNTPVTAEDVQFSLETLKSDAAHPNYQIYFQDITRAEILSPGKIRFYFARKNRELPLIACELPILPRKFYSTRSFDDNSLMQAMGSGPYMVETVKSGKSITYRRNPDYWGWDEPVRRGMFNFDTITYKYFMDVIVSLEAFKAQEFDFMYINMAKQWARDLTGSKYDQKILIKERLTHKNNAGMQGFVFNTRAPLFEDVRVRKALSLAFDFETANSTLFFNQYTRCSSYFSNSYLAATGLPKGLELALLEQYRGQVPEEVFTTPLTPFTTTPPNSLRANQRQAVKLLREAGWKIRDGMLVNSRNTPFEFEIILVSPAFERIMAGYANSLKKLGIKATYRTIDSALYIDRLNRFDFDMVVSTFGQSQSPGNEQRNYWHSSAADRHGSRNLAGIKDPAVDALVEKIIYATTREELQAACRALDRVLWYGYYLVPNWYIDVHRVTYRNIFERPEKLPLYYYPDDLLMTWWMKTDNR